MRSLQGYIIPEYKNFCTSFEQLSGVGETRCLPQEDWNLEPTLQTLQTSRRGGGLLGSVEYNLAFQEH